MLKKLLPDLHLESIYELNLVQLRQRGIKGMITDLDNTLIEWDKPSAPPELADWLKQVENAGFKVTVVSNNNEERVRRFCQPLSIPFIHSARKPFRASFKKAQQMMALEADEVVVIGDQLFTDVLGGNRLNLYTILVVPIAETDGFWTRFNRRLERIALYYMRKRGMISWEKADS